MEKKRPETKIYILLAMTSCRHFSQIPKAERQFSLGRLKAYSIFYYGNLCSTTMQGECHLRNNRKVAQRKNNLMAGALMGKSFPR